MTRPDAPLIEATAELLEGWCGPVVYAGEETVWWQDSRLTAVLTELCWADFGDGILLDLRRPEVQDRWGAVRWGSPALDLFGPGHPGRRRLDCGGRPVATSWPPVREGTAHVPALATLPDTDTLAWAIWHTEQAIRAGEGK